MSAGKSSIINALVGKEILHAANEATTAKVTRIRMGKFSKSNVSAYKRDGSLFESDKGVCGQQLREWNKNELIAEIDVNYALTARHSKTKLNGITILDTPGANNSVDGDHGKIFINALKANPHSKILYILNATQLGTNDDAEILKSIRNHHPAQDVVFVLNKVDLLDEELGESVKCYVEKTRDYLASQGFSSPVVVPVMALPALAGEKKLAQGALSRTERNLLAVQLEFFREKPQRLSRAALLPTYEKRNWQRRMKNFEKKQVKQLTKTELISFTDHCGLQVIKSLINNY